MPRLYSDLLDGTGRRYYFGLNSAPGGITNAAPAMLTLDGRQMTVQEQSTVFRNPATALLTLFGMSVGAEPRLQPGAAMLTINGQIPAQQRHAVITNALPPDYGVLPDNAPTILFIQTITPAPAALQVQTREVNLTQGGNIGFVAPGVASLSLAGFVPNFPRFQGDIALLTINGQAATLHTTIRIEPERAVLTALGLASRLQTPFVWVDEDPVAQPVWIDESAA